MFSGQLRACYRLSTVVSQYCNHSTAQRNQPAQAGKQVRADERAITQASRQSIYCSIAAHRKQAQHSTAQRNQSAQSRIANTCHSECDNASRQTESIYRSIAVHREQEHKTTQPARTKPQSKYVSIRVRQRKHPERVGARSRVDLPAQAKFLTCAPTVARAFPSTTTPRHTNQAGLWVRVRVRVVVATVSRGRK